MNLEELYRIFPEKPVIVTDTRKIKNGGIFFALKGDNFNGNSFADSAIQKGCSWAVVDDKTLVSNDRFIYVDDCLRTLQDLANFHRMRFNIPVFALTGTNGKTTTKELISSVLSEKYCITATKGNLNNHIGVPLSLLEINESSRIAVIEMGANHPGEIAQLCRIARPAIGMITNIGKAHLEGFGSFEGVIKAKSELYNYLSETKGTIFINSDDPILNSLKLPDKIIKYGVSEDNDYSGRLISSSPVVQFCWKTKNDPCKNYTTVKSGLPGSYNFYNLLAAVSVGDYFGVSQDMIKHAIENYTPVNLRSQLVKTDKNTILIDAYNANPSSMEVALYDFLEVEADNKIVILGDMLELGSYSSGEHNKIIEFLTRNNIEAFLIGKNFRKAALSGNYSSFNDIDEFIEWLTIHSIISCYILLKGSRGMKLEKAMDYL